MCVLPGFLRTLPATGSPVSSLRYLAAGVRPHAQCQPYFFFGPGRKDCEDCRAKLYVSVIKSVHDDLCRWVMSRGMATQVSQALSFVLDEL